MASVTEYRLCAVREAGLHPIDEKSKWGSYCTFHGNLRHKMGGSAAMREALQSSRREFLTKSTRQEGPCEGCDTWTRLETMRFFVADDEDKDIFVRDNEPGMLLCPKCHEVLRMVSEEGLVRIERLRARVAGWGLRWKRAVPEMDVETMEPKPYLI